MAWLELWVFPAVSLSSPSVPRGNGLSISQPCTEEFLALPFHPWISPFPSWASGLAGSGPPHRLLRSWGGGRYPNQSRVQHPPRNLLPCPRTSPHCSLILNSSWIRNDLGGYALLFIPAYVKHLYFQSVSSRTFDSHCFSSQKAWH